MEESKALERKQYQVLEKGNYMNGWIIRPFKHFFCGMIRGHKWKNTSPTDLHWVCQKCVYCGKERII